MDDTKTQPSVEETNKDSVESVEETAEKAVEEQNPVEEPQKELEAPEKQAEIEAPKEELIEAKEEEGQTEHTEEKVEAPKVSSLSDNAKWYIVHTYSGHENKVAKSLRQRVESMGFEEKIFDIIVPTRNTIKVSQGKKETVKEKIFPGYVLVKMILDDESWLLVRTTQGVTAFIGAGNKPTPISDKEVEAIQKFIDTEEPLYKTAFVKGEAVKIVDGPFTDFLGTIDNIDEAKGKLKVLVSIFGRETPVELDFLQVAKL
jgi:transcriptional antiterminator NusG